MPTRRAATREPDLVVVVQRADAHSGRLGHASHGPVIFRGTDWGA
ncbi:hypothetical protein [Streptomyces sp. NPDC056682]